MNPEELVARGLRAYELGRVLTASRITLPRLPVAALCLLETEGGRLVLVLPSFCSVPSSGYGGRIAKGRTASRPDFSPARCR